LGETTVCGDKREIGQICHQRTWKKLVQHLWSQKTGRPEKYHKAFVRFLAAVWYFFDCLCGKILASLLRRIIGFLAGESNLDETI